jgi:hypothetical protein
MHRGRIIIHGGLDKSRIACRYCQPPAGNDHNCDDDPAWHGSLRLAFQFHRHLIRIAEAQQTFVGDLAHDIGAL